MRLMFHMFPYVACRISPVPEKSRFRKRFFGRNSRTANNKTLVMSASLSLTPAFITQGICFPIIDNDSITSTNEQSGEDGRASPSPMVASILKPFVQSVRSSYPRIFSAIKPRASVVRFNPVITVHFLTENGVESVIHTQSIANEVNAISRNRERQRMALPSVKLPNISE